MLDLLENIVNIADVHHLENQEQATSDSLETVH